MTALPDEVVSLVSESLSHNSRRAYLSDLSHFELWGGVVPSSDRQIATYLADHAKTLSVATLLRRLSSITKAHRAMGFSSPVTTELVKATIRGIKRTYGKPQREAAPLVRDSLLAMLDAMGNRTKDVRDHALLLLGFAGGFRRSELVSLDICDVEFAQRGLVITINRSKTDQTGQGRKLAVPYGRTRHCPVLALERWLQAGEITEGPLFRRVDRHGTVASVRLSDEAVSLIVKQRLTAVLVDPTRYSGHSLRAGFATSAAQAGVPAWSIRRQTGHASDAMLSRYIRVGELFSDNAAGALL